MPCHAMPCHAMQNGCVRASATLEARTPLGTHIATRTNVDTCCDPARSPAGFCHTRRTCGFTDRMIVFNAVLTQCMTSLLSFTCRQTSRCFTHVEASLYLARGHPKLCACGHRGGHPTSPPAQPCQFSYAGAAPCHACPHRHAHRVIVGTFAPVSTAESSS